MLKFNKLCVQAKVYLGVSLLSIIALLVQNMSCGRNYYKCGHLGADLKYDKWVFFAVKVVYVLIWTYLIDLLCKNNHSKFAWLFALMPFLGMFVLILLVIFQYSKFLIDRL
tara:strand:+ start:3601 stop:3933 length:333 start_codon:yes stop_codon:yes gene_type:complete